MSSLVAQSRWARLGHEFGQRLNPAEQAAVLSWASFTAMFTGLRLLTHWIHRGHGPKGGGIIYWSHDGRESVDVAIGVIALGATISAGMPLWPHARRALMDSTSRRLAAGRTNAWEPIWP